MASKGFWNENFHENGTNVPVTAEGFSECCQTIATSFSSNNINQNATPYFLINNGTYYQATSDLTSNAVLNYIGQIMLEEDIDEDIIVYQEETALRETEKSFYDLIGKKYPPLPSLVEPHTPQDENTTKNSDTSDVTQSVSETDGLSYSRSESLLTSADPSSALFMKNLPATQIQKGAEEALKFLPAFGKLSVSLEPNRSNVQEESIPNYVSESKAIGYETGTKRCALNDKEQYQSEGQARKQPAVFSDEPAIHENLDQFLHSSFNDYKEEVIMVRESMKQVMGKKSSQRRYTILVYSDHLHNCMQFFLPSIKISELFLIQLLLFYLQSSLSAILPPPIIYYSHIYFPRSERSEKIKKKKDRGTGKERGVSENPRSMETAKKDPSRRFAIGYALAPKKQESFIRPSLISLASSRGIDLVRIDPGRSLLSQGPFDCVLHKLSGDEWRSSLDEFSAAHPDVPVIDSLDAIERLHNRISMLQVVSELDTSTSASGETFGIPSQVVVYDSGALADSGLLEALRFPIIAKPLVADGTARSHKMSLVFTREGLQKLKPPLVLQEFVNHGGVIFKVYVVGAHVTCVKRRSLPDVSKENLECPAEGSVSFSQISNLTAKAQLRSAQDDLIRLDEAELPPISFVTEIASGLRKALGLRLFNFDMIRDTRVGTRYLIIDINYFPGYAKMPSYESVLTDFFSAIVRKEDGEKEANNNHKVETA